MEKNAKSAQMDPLKALGATKVIDIKGSAKQFPRVMGFLFDRYCKRYLTSNSRRVGPLVHMALLCGGLGYYWEYPHLSTFIQLLRWLLTTTLEHQQEHGAHDH